MNHVSLTPTSARTPAALHHPRRTRRRAYACALNATGAVNLSPDELRIITQAIAILEQKLLKHREPFNSPASVKQWLLLHYGLLQREVFGLLLLDAQNRLLAHEQPFTGTLMQTSVYPREIARLALAHNAAAAIAVHGHPSGEAEPSHADRVVTQNLKNALALLDVRLLDHFIVGGNNVLSFAERGLL